MITKFKLFESIRDEYADMFAPRKPEDMPQSIPEFQDGTIDPDDDEPWSEIHMKNKTNDKIIYEKEFLPLTKKRNFEETEDEIIINMTRLWHDFYMSIYGAKDHYMEFVRNELLGKYISKGYRNILTDEHYEGIINRIVFNFDGDSCFEEFQLNGQSWIENGFCEEFITIDILKTDANKYNV